MFTQGLLNSGKWQRRLWEHTIRDDADDTRHVQGVLAADCGGADGNDGEFGEPRAP